MMMTSLASHHAAERRGAVLELLEQSWSLKALHPQYLVVAGTIVKAARS